MGGGTEGFLAGRGLEGLVEAGEDPENTLGRRTCVNKCGGMGMSTKTVGVGWGGRTGRVG